MRTFDLHLQELPLFHKLSPREIETFIEHTSAAIQRYAKGDCLLKAYGKNSNIGVMAEGTAQVVSVDRWGNEAIGHELGRGALLGTISAILSEEHYSSSIVTLSDAVVLWIPYRSLLVAGPKLGRIHGLVMQNLLEAFCIKDMLKAERIELLSQRSLRERLILYLLQREKWQKSDAVRVPGRVQLARELGCNRSALTREIGQMKEDGILLCEKDIMRLVKDRIS